MILDLKDDDDYFVRCPICGELYYCHPCARGPTDECGNCIIEGKASKEATDWF